VDVSPPEPDGERLIVRTLCFSINRKDALALLAAAPVVRSFPRTPGVDVVGIVEHSPSPAFVVGDVVYAHGFGMGVDRDGSMAELLHVDPCRARVLSVGMSPLDAITLGVAGVTAGLALDAVKECGLGPSDGEVIVNGATGGVGSLAIALFSAVGYRCVAATGKTGQEARLRGLGASRVLATGKADAEEEVTLLGKAEWLAAVDSLGGQQLAQLAKNMLPGGLIAACGNASGNEVPTSVMPFILRGITVKGIVASTEKPPLEKIWRVLEGQFPRELLGSIRTVIAKEEVLPVAARMLAGAGVGRYVVDVAKHSKR
jgi:putative YhdH/YhfP family quinone oxidoreductase